MTTEEFEKEAYRLGASGMSEGRAKKTLSLSDEEWTQFSTSFEKGRSDISIKLLEEQIHIALDRNHRDQCKMLLHLGKTMLGQVEIQESRQTHVVSTAGYDQLLKILE